MQTYSKRYLYLEYTPPGAWAQWPKVNISNLEPERTERHAFASTPADPWDTKGPKSVETDGLIEHSRI